VRQFRQHLHDRHVSYIVTLRGVGFVAGDDLLRDRRHRHAQHHGRAGLPMESGQPGELDLVHVRQRRAG
jgi:hypothetical protein